MRFSDPEILPMESERLKQSYAGLEMSGQTAIAGVRIERSIEPLAPEWDELADRLGAPPFLRPGWFAAWRHAFGEGKLEVLTLRRQGRLAGVLPLERHRGVLRGLANYHSPAFGALAEDREAMRELASRALAGTRRRLSLALIDGNGGLAAEARSAAAQSGCRVLTRPLLRTPVLEVEGEWEAHLARLSSRFRKELRRHRRRLEEMGAVEFEVAQGADGIAERMQELLSVEGSGWKQEARTAIISSPRTRRFYEELAGWASERGMLRLFFLRLDGEAIAVDFALEAGGVRYMLKGGFDARYASVAPGILLLEAGLAHAFEAGLDRVELGGGADPYKLRWTRTVRERRLVQAFPRTPLGIVDWGAFALGRPIAKRLLSPPRSGKPAWA